ncbi:serine O-acetyltransferase EpsC [Flavisolibacter ginsenosidimutans]|uniref:Serine acetyltransferase n=1 Tax=Flavisolibacter ginsenosidimutans TaxID=661481 RepID=A0A5B8UHC5_9BACT|nr:serine O-acetyltransferase EpsC [Flavisolibacter ginsenosidimutans]QEC55898.1 serine acetyltransferase [Flavisolibacter ginsenosidimutans]
MNEANFLYELTESRSELSQRFPDKHTAETFVGDAFHFLFVAGGKKMNYVQTEAEYKRLKSNLALLLAETSKNEAEVETIANTFFAELPHLYKILLQDAQAILDFDPAAQSIAEVVVAYPGFFATVVYRLSHQLWKQGVKLLPRLFTEFAHSKTGIDIHPGARIGTAFAIDHGTGIVVGETTVIGSNVKLYQGVTLGALNVAKELARSKRHPTIEDEVVIYSGATILGGETVIGKGSIIGGNVWLTYSVPSNSVVYHKSEIKIKDKNPFPEPINFII